jgi:hypothetical protein
MNELTPKEKIEQEIKVWLNEQKEALNKCNHFEFSSSYFLNALNEWYELYGKLTAAKLINNTLGLNLNSDFKTVR